MGQTESASSAPAFGSAPLLKETTDEKVVSSPTSPTTTVADLAKESLFSTRQIAAVHKKFQALATQSPDPEVLQRYQFKEALQAVGIDPADELVARLFDAFDLNASSTINFREFALGLSVLSHGDLREKLMLTYDIFDEDQRGINKEEMTKILVALDTQAQKLQCGAPASVERTESIKKFVDGVFSDYDREANGRLSFAEYLRAVMKHPALADFADPSSVDVLLGQKEQPQQRKVPAEQEESKDHSCIRCIVGIKKCSHGNCCKDVYIKLGTQHDFIQFRPEKGKQLTFVVAEDEDEQ